MTVTKEILSKYTPVIGLEIHAQLLTNTKMFAPEGSSYGELPNTGVSQITIAHPGAMPSVNKQAIEYAVRMGLASNSEINRKNYFARKNYFYPDLPKGYQITQHEDPICKGGYIIIGHQKSNLYKDSQSEKSLEKDVSNNRDLSKDHKIKVEEKQIRLTRIHLEEDTGKSLHGLAENRTLIDYNRAGTPLIEIVTEPDISNSTEAYYLLHEIRKIVRYLRICNGNMEEGSLRCDANVSVMPKGSNIYGTKVEVKNMNSIRNVQIAIEHEIHRQISEIEKGNKVISETRSFDSEKNITISQRSKENLNDYRYFIEPDLSPVLISDEYLFNIKNSLPLLPRERLIILQSEYGLSEYDANIISEDRDIAEYFDGIIEHTKNYKAAANWIMGPIKSYLNELKLNIQKFEIKPQQIAQIISLIQDGKITFSSASQKLFPEMVSSPKSEVKKLAQSLGLIIEVTKDVVIDKIEEALKENPTKVEEYQSGKKGLLGFFVGEVMKKTKGKADPRIINEELQKRLED